MEKTDLINRKCSYVRAMDGATYEGIIEKVNEKAGTVIIEGGWTPTCRYVAKIKDVSLL